MKIDQETVYLSLRSFGDREVPKTNNISDYLPYRSKEADFSQRYVAGELISYVLDKRLEKKFSKDALADKVIDELEEMTVEGEFGRLARDIYFRGDGINKLSPAFLILNTLKGEDKVSKSSEQLADLFKDFIGEATVELGEPSFNFIESIVVEMYKGELVATDKARGGVEPYLPFLSKTFLKDFVFLSSKPHFLLEKIEDFLSLYNFLYCSQLGANIRNWKQGEPAPVEHYFIIDTEKCSGERKASKDYKELRQSVNGVFPVLTVVHELNSEIRKAGPALPLWQLAEVLESMNEAQQTELTGSLHDYVDKFCAEEASKGRELMPRPREESSPGVVGALERFVHIGLDQFNPNRVVGSSKKEDMLKKYLKTFELEVAKHFVQARGRLGKVLVINQDYLLMLTNIVIGDSGEMRLQEILREFELRGIYLDKQSQLSLIAFYERIGNVKRMSDSGDAVYVKSTV